MVFRAKIRFRKLSKIWLFFHTRFCLGLKLKVGVLIFGDWIWMWWEEFKMISVILETAPPHHCLRARGEFNLFNFSSKRTENHFSNYQNTDLFFLWDVSSGLKLCLWLKTLYIRRNLFKNKFFLASFAIFSFICPSSSVGK